MVVSKRNRKKIVDFSDELIALTVLRWIQTRYLRITKPEHQPMQHRGGVGGIMLWCYVMLSYDEGGI